MRRPPTNKTEARSQPPKRGNLSSSSSSPPQSSSSPSSVGHIMADSGAGVGMRVWVACPKDGYQQGAISDIHKDSVQVRFQDGTLVTALYGSVFPVAERSDVDDCCALTYLNDATLLESTKCRYSKKKIYTLVGNILISVNPYVEIHGLYDDEAIKKYRGKSLGTLPPHIFAIADRACREMFRSGQSQSIVVSGESGAGKTESQKQVLRYLCKNFSGDETAIQQRILDANPLLEAFGNARTVRNNNSSRFGKFIEVHFGDGKQVTGGYIAHYLLERSRVTHQSPGERNYHVFYQLLAGANDNLWSKLGLLPAERFEYLKHGTTAFIVDSSNTIPANRLSADATICDSTVDDARGWKRLKKSLQTFGIQNIDTLWATVAAILHLGNIRFVEVEGGARGGCIVDEATTQHCEMAANLLGLEPSELQRNVTTRMMQPASGTLISKRLQVSEATAARDGLAKAIYSRVFDRLVKHVNDAIPSGVVRSYIGVLDIAGFEHFEHNSFEQFCINYCNERLQLFFNERILDQEQELYASEGLNIQRVDYTSNSDCIELLDGHPTGLFDLLDEECRLPQSSSEHFTMQAHGKHKGSTRLEPPRRTKAKGQKNMRDEEAFIVRHYADSVCYMTKDFLKKNTDSLHVSLQYLLESSSNSLILELFANPDAPPPKHGVSISRLQGTTVSGKFRRQLTELVGKLKDTGTHFVRCVKPNADKTPLKWDGSMCLAQLRCAGLPAVLRLMDRGFPSRTGFADLYSIYEKGMPERLRNLGPRMFCQCLFRTVGFGMNDFAFGYTKIFFRAGRFAEFDRLMQCDERTLKERFARVLSWLVRARWKKVQYCAWSCVKLRRKIEYLAEVARAKEEARRRAEEEARAAEAARVAAEKARAEAARAAVERAKAETARIAADKAAKEEAARVEQEAARAAEAARMEQEKKRVTKASRGAEQNISDVLDQQKMDEKSPSSSATAVLNELATWAFSKLRDTINNSTDMDLLAACTEEFHRRLESFKKWQASNEKTGALRH